jgi:hypothetical protein
MKPTEHILDADERGQARIFYIRVHPRSPMLFWRRPRPINKKAGLK